MTGTPLNATTPSIARIYNHALGGKDNYPADRQLSWRAHKGLPPGLARITSGLVKPNTLGGGR
jgi:S-adenosyl methyltransferase